MFYAINSDAVCFFDQNLQRPRLQRRIVHCSLEKPIMKCAVIFFAVLMVVTIDQAQANTQSWGSQGQSTNLLHRETIRWVNSSHNRLRRQFRFPFNSNDESRLPRIGLVVVRHQFGNTEAVLSWGGPGHKYVGLEIISGPGEGIDTEVEVYAGF